MYTCIGNDDTIKRVTGPVQSKSRIYNSVKIFAANLQPDSIGKIGYDFIGMNSDSLYFKQVLQFQADDRGDGNFVFVNQFRDFSGDFVKPSGKQPDNYVCIKVNQDEFPFPR